MFIRCFCLLIVFVGLIGCAEDKIVLEGERETVLLNQDILKPSESVINLEVVLPDAVTNRDWPQAGGEPSHSMPPLTLPDEVKTIWNKGIGHGARYSRHFSSEPIVYQDKLFVLNGYGEAQALDASTGKLIWQTSITIEDDSNQALGGGLSYDDDTIFVSSPYAEILALEAETGVIKWRVLVNSPVRTAPTVKDGRVFIVTINNELEVFDSKTGTSLWSHAGMMESAGLLGGGSPSVDGGVVVVPYSSGEVYALRVENGYQLWSDSLASFKRIDSVSSLPHIKARPVISQDLVILVSHSGRTVAIDLRSGNQVWSRDFGGVQSPAVAGNFVFLLTSDNQLVCLTRDKGIVRWTKQLPMINDVKDAGTRIVWNGPLLAGERLIITGSNGKALILSAKDGKELSSIQLPGQAFVPPIIANNTIYFLTGDSELIAMR